MKKNLKKDLDNFESFFAAPRTTNQKAWGVINNFYNLALSFMFENKISQAELARTLGKSRSAISQMFRKTPNISIKRMIEIADAIGFNVNIYSENVRNNENKIQYIYVIAHTTSNTIENEIVFDNIQSKRNISDKSIIESTNSYFEVSYGK